MKFTKYNFFCLAVVVALICSLTITSVFAASGNIKDVTREAELDAADIIASGTWSVNTDEPIGAATNENTTSPEEYNSAYARDIAKAFNEYWSQFALGAFVPNREHAFTSLVSKATRNREGMSDEEVAEITDVLNQARAKLITRDNTSAVVAVIDEFKNWTPKEITVLAQQFSDVNPGDWFYDTVTEMTAKGYFAGKGPVVNGVGTFAPYDVMTRAEFNAVIARILFGEIANEPVAGKPWWYKSDYLLRGRSLIRNNDFTDGVEVPMTREEMAYMCANVFLWSEINKLSIADDPAVFDNTDAAKDKIPDYKAIEAGGYLDSVVTCYSQGILCGVDSIGTFNPKGYLTRAEATSVLYRLINREARTPVDLSVKLEYGVSDPNAPITIYEGRLRANRFAKEGDTVIKEDGTQIVLKKGPHGVLGEGQPVAADLGMTVGLEPYDKSVFFGNKNWLHFYGDTDHKDSLGNPIRGEIYLVNGVTGEAHWFWEWKAITAEPAANGTFDCQLSPDKNWVWFADREEWVSIFTQTVSSEGRNMILEANGIK